MSHQRIPSRASSDTDHHEGPLSAQQKRTSETQVAVEMTDVGTHPRDCPEHQTDDDHTSGIDQSPPDASSTPHGPQGMIARKRTLLQVALTFLPRWLLTVAIALSIYAVLAAYSSRTVMSQKSKRGFNAIITGLSIMQGLVIVGSLNAMVGDLRWWVLSRRFRSRTKVERILRADSILQLINLARKSKRPSIYLGVLFWLLVVIGCQIGVASLNLLYSTAVSDKWALTVRGDIMVADMSTIYTDKVVVASKARTLGALQYTANSYGIISTAYSTVLGFDEIPKPNAIFSLGEPFLFWDPINNTFAYLLRETSVESVITNGIWAVTVASNRTIQTQTYCKSYNVLQGGNGEQLSLLIEGEKGQPPENITIPAAGGRDQTTYFTNTTQNCGAACSPVMAFETTDDGAWFYRCNVTIPPVKNATRKEHELGPEVAILATSAIALQGYGVSSLATDNATQYQIYPLESLFGSSANGSAMHMGTLMSRFTIGVIAAVAEGNNMTIIPNTDAPEAGVTLTIGHVDLVVLILVGVVGIQLILEVLVAVMSNRVVVPPRGAVHMAQVLRAMTMDEASMTWPEKSTLWMRKSGEVPDGMRGRWRYRVTPAGNGAYDLAMEKASQ